MSETDQEVAEALLLEWLREGPVEAQVVLARAVEAGIVPRVLEHARRNLEIVSRRDHGKVWWSL